ncbi:hypothetical protein Tco_0378044 [Tanacetum coccineum]
MCTFKVSAYNFRRSLFHCPYNRGARFETIIGKKLNTEKKIDIVLSWPSEEAPPVIKWSLDANEDIGVVEVSSAIDDVFDICESNVESMEVRSEFSEFSKNKESVEEVVVGGGEACGVGEDELNRVVLALKDGDGEFDDRLNEINLDLSEELADNGVSPIPTSFMAHQSPRVRQLWERIGIGNDHGLMDNGRNHKFVQPNVWGWMSDSQSAYSSYHLEGKVIFEGVGSVTAWVAEGGRMVLCYVQGSGRRKRKKGVGCGSGRQENYGSGRRDCGRIRIWDPGIKRVFQDNTLRTRWFRRRQGDFLKEWDVTHGVAKGGRMVLCYVQGSGRRKRKKGVGCGSRRQENYGSGRRDCGRIRIWDSEIKRVFQDNTLRIKWFRKSGE